MLENGDHSEDNITLYRQHGGQNALGEWIKKLGLSDQDGTTPKHLGDDAVMVSDTINSQDQIHTTDSAAVRPVNRNDIHQYKTHIGGRRNGNNAGHARYADYIAA